MTNYVKAKMAFYHDSVGTRAHNEVFQVKNAQTLSDLEKNGYVEKVDAQEMEQAQKRQELVGKRNALTNEAVSMANHEHNVQANAHTQNVAQQRQQQAQQAQTHNESQTNNATSAQRATAKKANEK